MSESFAPQEERNMEEFKIGDIVTLLSGGPKMTVTDVGVEQGLAFVRCRWFDLSLNVQMSAFTPDTLRHTD